MLIIIAATMARVALKDITLRDGTVIPQGMLVMAAVDATHHDEAVFENADTFDPFRFARMREKDGEAHKHQLVHTTVDFVAFGHGRQAWWVLGVSSCHSRVVLLTFACQS